jgi:hypothetical protein
LSKDNDTYYRCIHSLHGRLSEVYGDSSMPLAARIEKKKRIIAGFKDSLACHYDSIFLTRAYRGLEKTEINNAFIGIDMTYSRDLDLFYRLYARKNRDLRATLAAIKSIEKKSGNYKENMRKLLLR